MTAVGEAAASRKSRGPLRGRVYPGNRGRSLAEVVFLAQAGRLITGLPVPA